MVGKPGQMYARAAESGGNEKEEDPGAKPGGKAQCSSSNGEMKGSPQGGGAAEEAIETNWGRRGLLAAGFALDGVGAAAADQAKIKQDGDDSNRNRAKYRDGMQHFASLNRRLSEAGEPWRYHFYFLSPEDYPEFFDKVREKAFAGWRSGMMQGLGS